MGTLKVGLLAGLVTKTCLQEQENLQKEKSLHPFVFEISIDLASTIFDQTLTLNYQKVTKVTIKDLH